MERLEIKELRNNSNRKKSIVTQMITIILIAVTMMVVLLFWGHMSYVDRILINNRIVSEDISEEEAVYLLDLSDMENTGQYSLHFKSYGNTISVIADGVEIYSYTGDPESITDDIGRIYVSAILPEQVNDLKIVLEKSDANASPDLVKIELCDKCEVNRYYLTNDTLGLPMSLIYSVIGFMALLSSVVLFRWKKLRNTLFFFSLTLLSMAVELADTGGHYLIFFNHPYIWNIIFYFACYVLPFSSAMYCYCMIGEKYPSKYRKIAMIGVWINIAYGVICTVLSFITDYSFSDFAQYYVYDLAACLIFALFSLIIILKYRIIGGGIIPIVVAFGFWGVSALIFTVVDNSLVNVGGGVVLDMETLQSIIILMVLGGAFVYYIIKEFEAIENDRLRVVHLEEERQNLRYKIFASQMQPHFLYNALSSIQQIVYEDQDYAAKLIRNFTIHLRATIRAMSNDQPIPFLDELKNIKSYIIIEQMRFGDRLAVKYDIQADDFDIVPLCIQPIVENSVKHGIYKRGEAGGEVTISTRETEDSWIIEVSDNGVGFRVEEVLAAKEKEGSVGMKNLIYRLENLMNASIEIESTVNVGTRTTVTIPKIKKVEQ